MYPVNLAYPVEQGANSLGSFLRILWDFGVVHHPAVGLSVLAVLVIGVLWVWWLRRSYLRRRVGGTARVVSLKKTAPDQGGRCWCQIELEINIPGREPYGASRTKHLGPAEQAAVQPGRSFQAWVDLRDQEFLGIDFNQPML
jgi:hypothetical protein